jgi:nicotinamidase/pyrazinamidase
MKFTDSPATENRAMLDGPLVFVDVDTQRDFLDPAGALFVPGSEPILGNLGRLTAFARERGIPILATACRHSPDDAELRDFPPHCMEGSPGQERIEATAWNAPGARVLGPSEPFSGDPPPHLTVQKREFDVFSHPAAESLVARYNRDRPTFVVYGVATDYCVAAAVRGLLDRACKVAVVVDAVRAIDAAHEADVFDEFTRRGALLTLTDAVCGQD